MDFNFSNVKFGAEVTAPTEQGRGQSGFPRMTIMSQKGFTGSNTTPAYFFIVTGDLSNDLGALGWERDEYDFDSGTKEIWKTDRARLCLVSYRTRWNYTLKNGRVVRIPAFTRKDDRPFAPDEVASVKSQTQIVAALPELNEDGSLALIQIGIAGPGKSIPWSNNPEDAYGRSEWPLGVEQLLKGMAAAYDQAAREGGYEGSRLPYLGLFWTDLVGMTNDKGKAVWIKPSKKFGTQMNPWTIDTSTVEYVGDEMFSRIDAWRAEEGVGWRQEWGNIDVEESNQSGGGDDDNDDGFVASNMEEDEIPF